MTVNNNTGAHRDNTNLMHKHEANVKRLQQRIVKAVKELLVFGDIRRLSRGLSRMRGNSQVRFLGGKGLVTAPDYPVCLIRANPRPSAAYKT